MKRLVCLLAVLGLLSLTSIAEAKKVFIKWGATNVRSGLYANTVAMASIVKKAYPGEIEVTVVETGGYLENLVRIQKKSIHMGPADAAAGYAAYEGIIDYKGKQIKDLRVMWGGYITPIHIVTTKKSGADTLEKINGLPFASNPGTTSGRAIELFFDANGIKPVYKMMGIGASVDALKSGVASGWYKAGFKDASILDLESSMDINVIPITKKHVENMEKKYPGQIKTMTIPAGLFKAVTKEQLSFAYVVTDFVHKDVPEDVVYKIVKAIYENRASLVGSLSTLREGKFDDMYANAEKYIQVPLHPGAVKFYQEVLKVKVPDRLLPPEMKKK
ncbi:MAG: TAXI family TRAP transporter solute-binding subunit [Thermodesulfovibrionales bacterium]|nr:TAXI family TRAP transporter solute-binding subunit [Thermodesulfovibrionales bacterium]